MLPYLRLADDVNPHCCAEKLLPGACVPPQDMSVVPPEPRLEMNLLLCDCWSWRSRWGWDGTLYFWNTPPAVFTSGPYWRPTVVTCTPDNTEARSGALLFWVSRGKSRGIPGGLASVMVLPQETLHHWHYSAESIIRLFLREILTAMTDCEKYIFAVSHSMFIIMLKAMLRAKPFYSKNHVIMFVFINIFCIGCTFPYYF